MSRIARQVFAVAVLAVVLAPGPSAAQDASRAALIAARQADKARTLHAYVPNKGERIALRIESILSAQPRVYTWFGSIYRGGWVAAGPGFRQKFGGTGLFDAHAGISLRNYKLVDTSVRLPSLAGQRLQVAGQATWLDAPKVAFYGIGNRSLPHDEDAHEQFQYQSTTAGGHADLRVAGPLSVGGSVDYLRVESDASNPAAFGSQAVLFETNPSWVRSSAFGLFDWRPSPLYARRGGFWRATWSNYAQQAGTGFAFREFEAEASQLVPILRENWVIALRARVTTTYTDAGNDVPFYLLPSLGGGSSVRGYHSWRFRDRNALLLNAEYRWTPSHFLDMALFLDAGQVAPRPADLHFTELHTGYGIGARFHTPAATVLRIDVARSEEGFTVHWSTVQRF